MDRYEYIGHLHIHSNFSDGSGSIQEIARAGREAGLDFIGVTDHNTLAGREEGFEGRQNDILVLIGIEFGKEKNHYIAFGVDKLPGDTRDPQKVIDSVNAQGGFGYLAHPGEKSNPAFLGGKAYPWDRWDVKNFKGLEIWNFSSIWREAYHKKTVAVFWFFADRYRGGRFPEPETLKKWDILAARRPVTAFGGSDAHAFPVHLGPLKLSVFAYNFLFRTVNTHLLLKEKLSRQSSRAREQVLKALREGSFFIGSDYYAPTRGFRFSAVNRDEEADMGGEIRRLPDTVLRIISPSKQGVVRIICNGKLVCESRRKIVVFKVLQEGVFRVEVYWRPRLGKPIPWIYSNPIYVKEQKPEAGRQETE